MEYKFLSLEMLFRHSLLDEINTEAVFHRVWEKDNLQSPVGKKDILIVLSVSVATTAWGLSD